MQQLTPQEIIAKVKEVIEPVYLVGGSVRDMLLNREPKDYDFTTPLTPDEIEERVRAAGRRVYDVGKKYGTIGFLVLNPYDNHNHYKVEVTTFRKEQYQPGSRKPSEVEFVKDLREDLSRRDFTINAIAYDGQDYIDPFGGRIDILERKIKAVGKAKDRFKEDPLRMLRAARFSAQLGFDIDPNLIGFIRKMARTIYTVSRERWVQEMDKLLAADECQRGLDALAQSYLLRYMLPEVQLAYIERVYIEPERDIMLEALKSAPHDADVRWAIFLAGIGLPFASDPANSSMARDVGSELVKGIAARLKFSNARTELVFKTASAGAKYQK